MHFSKLGLILQILTGGLKVLPLAYTKDDVRIKTLIADKIFNSFNTSPSLGNLNNMVSNFIFYFITISLTIVSTRFADTNSGLIIFISLLTISHVSWLSAFKYENTNLKSGQVCAAGTVFILALFSLPVWENDFYRYLLDGLHFNAGIEPYGIGPAESPLKKNFSQLISNIGFREVPTVYPPLAISFFSLLALITKNSDFYFLIISRLFYFIIFCLALIYLKNKKNIKMTSWVLMLFHPLVVVEGIINAHFDLIIGGLSCLLMASTEMIFFALPMAISLKYTLVTTTPFLIYKIMKSHIKKSRFVIPSILGILISTLPFFKGVFDISLMLRNISFFAQEWEMNSGVYRFFRYIISFSTRDLNQIIQISNILSMSTFMTIFILIFNRRKIFSLEKQLFLSLTALVLFAPVCNPWYFLWSLPFALNLKGHSGFWGRLFFLGTPLYYFNFLPEYFLIPSLNMQHAWYGLCFYKVFRSY